MRNVEIYVNDSAVKSNVNIENVIADYLDFSAPSWAERTITTSYSQSDPEGGNNAVKVSGTGSDSALYQTITITSSDVGKSFKYKVWMKGDSGTGTMNTGFKQGHKFNPQSTNITLTDTWQQYEATFTAQSSGTTNIHVIGGDTLYGSGNTDVYIFKPTLYYSDVVGEVDYNINTEDWTRLDLFDDETIQLTDSIQDVKDIKKVFTAFSQTFKVPASDNNNKLFKHYYNADIDGYDGRFRKDALIKIDGVDFKLGRVRLNSVDLAKNFPNAYNVTFFGSTVQLTELIGEDELSDLEGTTALSAYDFTYNDTFVKERFDGTQVDQTLVFPFISAKNYYYAESGSASTGIELPDGAVSRNIYDEGSAYTGVYYTDLKPAIKVSKVIDAIEEKYGLTFSNDFFATTTFTELYLWLHREKGQITEQISSTSFTYNITDFTVDGTPAWTGGDIITSESEVVSYGLRVYITAPVGQTYTISASGSGDGATNGTGTGSAVSHYFRYGFFAGYGTETPVITVSTTGGLTSYDIDLRIEELPWYIDDYGGGPDDEFYDFIAISETIPPVSVASQMPKMKVIDFLTSLFKMFNLTTYFDGTELVVKTLDNYYASGTSYDITEYIDTSNSKVLKSNIYRNVAFKFPEAKTFAVYNSNLLTGNEFGNEDFEDRDIDGGVYNVEVKFEKFMYERMTDQDSNALTDVQWGWFVDDNKNEYVSNALLMYIEKVNTSLEFHNGTVSSSITDYYKPHNVKTDGSQTLHFNSEIDEFTTLENTNSLFSNYYTTYINNVFDKKARIYTFTAYLPSQILNRYELNDTFIIGKREYRINKIKVNLLNGKSELELINKL